MQKEKVLRTGINQAARCSAQMGFPAPLGHLHPPAEWVLLAVPPDPTAAHRARGLGILQRPWDFLALLLWVCSCHRITCVDFHWEGHDRSSQRRAVMSRMPVKGRKEPTHDRFPAIGWWLGVVIKNSGAMQSLRDVAYTFRRKLNDSKLEIVLYPLAKKHLQFWTQLLPMAGLISIYI